MYISYRAIIKNSKCRKMIEDIHSMFCFSLWWKFLLTWTNIYIKI